MAGIGKDGVEGQYNKGEVSRSGVFLSYRRGDTSSWTGRLAEDLRRYFGSHRVYLDIDSTLPAQDYVAQLNQALNTSRVVIAVIGPTWVGAGSTPSTSRLDDPSDWVRRELEISLANGIAIVLVLVGGAQVPAQRSLPPSLAQLSRIQALRMSDDQWKYDLGRLLETLEANGLYTSSQPESASAATDFVAEHVVGARRYERSMAASRRRALDAAFAVSETLNYKGRRLDIEASCVVFTAAGREVVAKVIDGPAGRSVVVIEFKSVRSAALVAGTIATFTMTGGLSLLAGPALRAWERTFAKGLLDNVEAVLDGKGVIGDPVLPPGVSKHLKRNKKV